MDGREATGDGRIQATIIIQYPQGQTLTLQSTSTGLSPEQPDRLLFDVVVSGSYPADNELSIGQTLSVPLQQTALGVLSGQQNLEQGIIISLTITYQPLAPQAVPATLLLLQLTPAEVDTTGQTSTIKFSAVAELQLIQLTTVVAPIATPTTSATLAVVPTFSPTPKPTPTPPAQVDRLNGSLDSLAVSASRDPTQDGKLHWNVRLPPGTDPSQVIAFLPGLTIPYAWIGAMERPTELPDGLDLVGSSSFTSSVVLIFESGEMATVLHSSQGISLSEFSFSAKRNGSVPAGILLDQLFPISLILERTSDRTVQALGFMDSVQVTFTLSYTPSGIQFPLLNLTLEASAADTSMNPLDGSTVLTFSTTSRLSEVPIQTLGGSITGRLAPDLLLPVARITVLVVGDSNGQLNWNISELSDPNALDLYQVLYPAIVLSVSWLHAEGHSGQLKDGQEVTGNGQFTAVLHVRFASGHILTVNSTSHGFSIEEPKVSVLEVVISGNYPSNADLSSMQFLSLVLEQSGIGLLSGRQLASQDLHIDLTIAFIPLNPDNIPRSIMSVQLSAAEVAATGSTFSIHFGSRAVLSLFQPPSITIDLLPSTTVAASSTSVSSSLPLPTPTPPDQEMLLRGAVKGAALPTLEIIAQRDLQLSSRLEWIVRNFSILEELELYRSLLPFIPLSAALLADGKQFKIITGETEMNLIIIVELSPGRTLRVETSSSVQSSGYLFHQIEFSGSYPTISEVTSFYSISMMIRRNERGYVSGEQVLQGGHRISIQSNYLPSDFSPEDTFLLTAMTHSPEARGLSFVMSSISMFKATLGMLSSSISSVIPTSKAALSTGIANISSVAVSSPRPPPPLPPVFEEECCRAGALFALERPTEPLECRSDPALTCDSRRDDFCCECCNFGTLSYAAAKEVGCEVNRGSIFGDCRVVFEECCYGRVPRLPATTSTIILTKSMPTSSPIPTSTVRGVPLIPSTVSPTAIFPSPSPQTIPSSNLNRLTGNLNTLNVSGSRDKAQDGKLNWSIRLPPEIDAQQVITFIPGLTIPYAWIGAMERPAELPDGHDLVGSSSFTGTVVLNFDSGETATVLHSSPGVSLSELSFSAERNGSFPEGIELDQLLPISLILERVSDGTVRALGSRNGVQVTFTLRYAPNGIQFPLLNLTLEASATDATVDPLDGSTVLTFSTTSRLSEVPIQTIGGSITGRTDDGVVLPTARVTAYADRLRDGKLNWEIADLPGTNAVGSYRPLLPAIALSAAWLNAQETPERLMDGREATGDGRIQATVIIQYPQGQTLTLQSTSTGLSPEQPDRLLFDVVVSGSYPVDDELSIGQTLSVPLQQTALGVLSGQQNLEQKVVVSLTITYQPLSLQAVPTTLLLLQLSPSEVDTTGPTATIKFSAVAQLMLIQLPTVVVPTASPTICPPGYSGENCNTCSVGYYGNPAYDISCQKCDCNGNVNESLSQICDTLNGACFDCLNNTSGFQCDECKDGYWGDAVNGSCIACNCDSAGSRDEDCNKSSGQCNCTDNVSGRSCNQCRAGFWGLHTHNQCVECTCCTNGTVESQCDNESGECVCREGWSGEGCCSAIPKRGLKFKETSYLIYTSIGEGILHSIELDISFKPERSSGLVMYASQYKNGSGSYVLVQLKDGRFEFSFATGLSNIITVRSSSVITLNEWHFVAVEYSSSSGLALLNIDGSRSINRETWTHGEPILLQSGQIFVGKIPSDQVDHPTSVAVSAGFVGCIEQITIRRSGMLQITGRQQMQNISTCYEHY